MLTIVVSAVEFENLFEQRLRARFFIDGHNHNVFHIFVPFIHDFAFRLNFARIRDAVFTFVIPEQFVAANPYRIIADSRFFQNVFHFLPDFIVTFYVFVLFPI